MKKISKLNSGVNKKGDLKWELKRSPMIFQGTRPDEVTKNFC